MDNSYNKQDELYNVRMWKKTGDPKYFQNAYRSMQNLIHSATRKAAIGSNIPESVFKLRAIQQFHDTIKNYDDKKGAGLSTFVYHGINEKAKRLNYKYDRIARIPERNSGGIGIYHIGELNSVIDILHQKLNREPTNAEIAREMGYTTKQIEDIRKDMVKDYSLSGDVEDLSAFDDNAKDEDLLNAVYYDLTPAQKEYYDYVRGTHGKIAIRKHTGAVDKIEIGRRMGKSRKEIDTLAKGVAKMMKKLT
jgi:DNA-directed RNA polymerase specialized sigma subunit